MRQSAKTLKYGDKTVWEPWASDTGTIGVTLFVIIRKDWTYEPKTAAATKTATMFLP